jgi:hypothetical protein
MTVLLGLGKFISVQLLAEESLYDREQEKQEENRKVHLLFSTNRSIARQQRAVLISGASASSVEI